MIRVGVTGGTGSGKTTMLSILKNIGYTVIDADEISRRAFESSEVVNYLKNTYGESILEDNIDKKVDKKIDRKKLASIIFKDKEKLKEYNDVIMPLIGKKIEEEFKKAEDNGETMAFLDAPMLFENPGLIKIDVTVLMDANEEERIKRVMKRDGIKEEEVKLRMKNQMPREDKIKLSHLVIKNSGTLKELEEESLKLPERVRQIYGKKRREV